MFIDTIVLEAGKYIAAQTDSTLQKGLKNAGDSFCSDQKLKKLLETQIQKFAAFNEVAAPIEEIDFEGLCQYIRTSLIQDVKDCLYGLPQEKEAAIHRVQSAALEFAGAQTPESKKRTKQMLDQSCAIIYTYFWNSLSKESKAILSTLEQSRQTLEEGQEEMKRLLADIKEQMASYSFESDASRRSLLDRYLEQLAQETNSCDPDLNNYHFRSHSTAFLGREKELKFLRDCCEDDHPK